MAYVYNVPLWCKRKEAVEWQIKFSSNSLLKYAFFYMKRIIAYTPWHSIAAVKSVACNKQPLLKYIKNYEISFWVAISENTFSVVLEISENCLVLASNEVMLVENYLFERYLIEHIENGELMWISGTFCFFDLQ